jgi:hypothetical protein
MMPPDMIAFLFKKKRGPNYRYKKCTRRGSVWYKKLVPGTKVLFDDFLGRAVTAIFNRKGSFSYVPGSEIDEKRAGRSGRRRDLRRRWGGAQWNKEDMCL